MATRTSVHELRNRVEFLHRNLLRQGLVTAEELSAVAKRFPGKAKDDLWPHWAELRALAIGRAVTRKGDVSPEALKVAVDALADMSLEVRVPSINKTFAIVPASYQRIRFIEEHSWWLNRLEAAKALYMHKKNKGIPDVDLDGKVCGECNRPLAPGNMKELSSRIEKEIEYQRAMVYANVTAEGPEQVTEPGGWLKWGKRINLAENILIMETYHRVTYDMLARLPEAKSSDGLRTLPKSWAFLFSNLADKEHRPASELMKDRSLASIVAVVVLQAIRDQKSRNEQKLRSEMDKVKQPSKKKARR